ncbi:hypothetical protein PFISCL1PPCAC_9768, partial [Pristionchus fissidentatus]
FSFFLFSSRSLRSAMPRCSLPTQLHETESAPTATRRPAASWTDRIPATVTILDCSQKKAYVALRASARRTGHANYLAISTADAWKPLLKKYNDLFLFTYEENKFDDRHDTCEKLKDTLLCEVYV